MKKFNAKAGLFFGISMAILSVFQSFWITDGPINITRTLLLSVGSGIICGLLYGWFSGLFVASKLINTATKFEKQPGEEILFETLANHFMGMEAVGGKLYLTNNRLVFKSHQLNIQNHELSIVRSDIVGAERTKTAKLINNGLIVKSVNNKTDRFVVENADEWVEKLNHL